MSAWFVGAKSTELVYEADEAMKRDPAECDDGGKDIWVAFLKDAGRWNDAACGAQPSGYIFFDGGGMICTKMPKVGWEANGCKMKTWISHLPFVLERFKTLEEAPDLPGIMWFGGFHRLYILTPKTVADSIEVMERLVKGTESLRQEWEMDTQKMINGVAGLASVRKCGCLSGKQYADCCGKYIEDPEHKELRKSLGSTDL